MALSSRTRHASEYVEDDKNNPYKVKWGTNVKDLKERNKQFAGDKRKERDRMRELAKRLDRRSSVPNQMNWMDKRMYEVNRPPITEKKIILTRRKNPEKKLSKELKRSMSEKSRLGLAGVKALKGDNDDDYDSWNPDHQNGREKPRWNPLCDVGETEKYWIVRAELPGVSKDDILVELREEELIISGKREKNPSIGDKGKMKWVKTERGPGKFKRKICLLEVIDEHGSIEAVFKCGVLEVLIPKVEYQEKKYVTTPAGKRVPIQ